MSSAGIALRTRVCSSSSSSCSQSSDCVWILDDFEQKRKKKQRDRERGAVKTPTHSLYIHLHPHFSMIKKLRCNLSLYLFAAKSFYSLASSAHATPAKQGFSAAASLRMCPYFAFEFTTVPHTFLPTVKFVPLSLSTFYTT